MIALVRLSVLTVVFTIGLTRLGVPVSIVSVGYAALLAITLGLIVGFLVWLFGSND